MHDKLLMDLIIAGTRDQPRLKRYLRSYEAVAPVYEHMCILTPHEASSLEMTGLFGPNLHIHRLPHPTPGDYLSIDVHMLTWIIRLDLPSIEGRRGGFRSEIPIPAAYQPLMFNPFAREALAAKLFLHKTSPMTIISSG